MRESSYPGDYADLIEGNVITGNPTDGVLGFEYPNPFTPENGFEGTIFFQLAGNRISNNVFAHNGYRGGAFTGDLTLAGGFSEVFGYPESHSVNNCASSNAFSDPTFPAKIEGPGVARTPPPRARAVAWRQSNI